MGEEESVDDGNIYMQVYLSYLAQINKFLYLLCEEQTIMDFQLTEKNTLLTSTTLSPYVNVAPSANRGSSWEEVEDEYIIVQHCKLKAEWPNLLEEVEISKGAHNVGWDLNDDQIHYSYSNVQMNTEEQILGPPLDKARHIQYRAW